MKPLKDTLNESLLNKSLLNESLLDDEDELFNRNDKTLVELWIRENYKIYGTLKIYEDKHGFVVDSNDKIEVTNKDIKSLTNGMFQWGEIMGSFTCEKCKKLTSLEGAPKKCYNFYCSECTELISLEGAPSECNWFDCPKCTGLRSLEGAPQTVGNFYCRGCNELKTLKGAPQRVDVWLDCSKCTELRSLEGAPKKCNNFNCENCTTLTSLEGVPVGATIICVNCPGLTITDDDRKKYKISL